MLAAVAVGIVAAIAGGAFASSVDESIVDTTAPTGSVTLAPGGNGIITINLSVTGNQVGTATFEVYRDWALSGGTFTGSNPQTFTVGPQSGGTTTTFSTTGTVTADAGQAAGTFTLAVGAFNITNSNTTGAKLNAGSSSNYSVTVTAPPPPTDTTPPDVSCSPEGDSTNWYATNQTVTCTASDSGSGLADPTNDASFTLTTTVADGTEDGAAQTGSRTVYDTAGNFTTVGPYTFMIDREAPQLSGCDSADGNWHADNVTLYCTYTDGGSGPATQQVALTTNVAAGSETSDAAASAGGAQACDAVNNCAASPSDITGNMIDRKSPTITCPSPAPQFTVQQSPANVVGSASDGGSGLATSATPSAAADTSAITASGSVTLSATDNVGNGATKSCSYSVIYGQSAVQFLQPINGTAHTIVGNPNVSTFKAGSTVPVKVQVVLPDGTIVHPASATWMSPQQGSGTTQPIDQTIFNAPADSGSSYTWDSTGQFYQYNWGTPKSGAGHYWLIGVKLDDGQTYTVYISLR
ncbi:MAG TPA: PxKF domain-containing protein [Gaiellaceae bacterium]|nr:PxKF domain-containing protein [Gaiellaceae bacterium]